FRVSSDIRLRPGFVIYDFYGITLTLNQVDDTLQDIIRQHQVYFFLSPPYTTEFILSVMEVPDHLLQGIFPLLIRQKITGLFLHTLVVKVEPLLDRRLIHTILSAGDDALVHI